MPMMLTLVEALAGREKAEEVAAELGLARWDARHASAAFRITRPFALTVLRNRLAFWNREQLDLRLAPGIDEVSLALIADAWSRTYRSGLRVVAESDRPIVTANGIRVLPDAQSGGTPAERRVTTFPEVPPAGALEQALDGIAERYGNPTARVVALQLEYPWTGSPR